jgi:hypothetical protein
MKKIADRDLGIDIGVQRGRDEASSQELLKQTKGITRTLSLLEKSIGRFKLSAS